MALRILLVGGGSAGHIVPHFAVVSTLKKRHPRIQFHYIGSRQPLDAQLVGAQNLPFTGIFAGKLRRYFSWHYLIDPFLMSLGFLQSLWVILRFRPHLVFSKGGYVSVPVALAAFILRRPLVLHESDASMGLANRLMTVLAQKICVSFPSMEHLPKHLLTGNPVRLELKEGQLKKGTLLTGFDRRLPVVLIWGGSQGARQINEQVQKEFKALVTHFYVIHITGVKKSLELDHPHYRAFEYVGEELKDLYAISDAVLGRAGANSLFELALLQKPNLVFPLKNADQKANAAYFVAQGASHLFDEEKSLLTQLQALLGDPVKKEKMKHALNQLAQPEAAQKIAKVISAILP